jgi:[ribosomal protein S5]-alanine N-acetyltransferase
MSHPLDTVKTGRLRGERPRAEYAELYVELLGDAEVALSLFPPPIDGGPRSREEAAEWLEDDIDHWAELGFGPWIFFQSESDRFVGRGGLRRTEVLGRSTFEVTLALLPEAWGKGYATEMAVKAVDTARAERLDEVCGLVLPTNRASQRVLEKADLSYERDVEHAGLRHRFSRLALPRPGAPSRSAES